MSPTSAKLQPYISAQHRRPPFSIESPGAPQIPGETKPRRNSKLVGKSGLLSGPNDKVQTAYDVVTWAAEVFGEKHAFGTRQSGVEKGALPGDSLVGRHRRFFFPLILLLEWRG